MNRSNEDKLCVVRDYHERTKHRPDRYAASLGYMDWANQPNPFRAYDGAEQTDLPHPELREVPTYDGLFTQYPDAKRLNADLIGRLFYHSLALSAWKQASETNRWSLRINPSSGALHPTEGYLICGPVPGLIESPGVFHYAPLRHRLERRCRLTERQWETLSKHLPHPCLLIGLSSIYWRESWKYGERAFRYCHHDVGHAIGTIAFSARALGWRAQVLDTLADEDLNRLLGTHLQTGIEAEHADCLLVLFPADETFAEESIHGLPPAQCRLRVPDVTFEGGPNRLSRDHHAWPAIEEVSIASQLGPVEPATKPMHLQTSPIPPGLLPDRKHPAERIIRQRRSAVHMDAETSLDRATFYQMLQRTLPAHFPFAALPWTPRISLAIFVHRVDDLDPGLYLLIRDKSHDSALQNSLTSDFEWHIPEALPRELRLYRLLAGDACNAAKLISCHQDIAADGAFSLGMMAEFDATLIHRGSGFYPRLFWESGLIGQVLYLEAEAAGVRGTGIGCFFDDAMHDLLGITDRSWQSLYHFTIGGPVEDPRLKTIPPYAPVFREDCLKTRADRTDVDGQRTV